MIERVVAVVPAADEETSIGACLAALRIAADAVAVPVRIVVVLDACTDGTAAIAGQCSGVETVTSSARNVGAARRAGVAYGLRGVDACRVWVANTDADSQVPPDWFERALAVADAGEDSADLVLGTVVPDVGLRPSVERSWFADHALQEGHPYVHAANLGVRGDAYLALGGWRPLAVHEDVDLTDRAVAAGLRVHRTALLPVRTSARPVGRAPAGFSSYLRALGHL